MVYMFAEKTRRRVMIDRTRRTLRTMKTGPDGREGMNGARVSGIIVKSGR